MIYPANFEEKIGFDRIREQVTALCSTPSAKAKLAEEGFSTSADEIERRLSLMNEMRSLLMLERDFPDGDYPDPAPLVAKIRVEGSYLLAAEADQLRKALVTVGAIAEFILGRGGARYPRLWELSRRVTLFPEIVRAIDVILDDRGEVKDSASPELQQVRRAIREREGQAAKRLQQVLQRAKQAGIVDADAVLSVRDGRPVIPVAAANKRKLQGFIHDESATGRTFYVEPVEVVEINNELKELEYAERREVVKVLSTFTESIRPDAEAIADAGDYLSSVDMIRAKARWALANDAGKPILSTDDRLELRTARHPLLQQTLRAQGREVVPLHLALDRRKHILVISGPNAGGKSVCLKTTGLMQYLFQCGYPVPASEVSELPVFRSIFIDIGDEQSIDNDLSTYSSHLLNMKHMLAGASGRTLVLIDEFGSGTEPTIGGAIAEAILERLLERGCYGVVTTHYANIKYFASNAEGVANGAMLFDVQRIRPLFKLEIGKPGSSFAVEIARKSQKEVQSDYYPQIEGYYSMTQSGNTPGMQRSGENGSHVTNWEVGAQATWNVFEWGTTYYADKQAGWQVTKMRYEQENLKLEVGYDIKSKYLAVQEARKRIAVAQNSVAQATEAYNVALARYHEHVGTNFDVLDASANLTSAQSSLTGAKADYLTALSQIYVAMGEYHPDLLREGGAARRK